MQDHDLPAPAWNVEGHSKLRMIRLSCMIYRTRRPPMFPAAMLVMINPYDLTLNLSPSHTTVQPRAKR